MAVARMRKVFIFALKDLKEPIFERLRDLGIMQVTDVASESGFEEAPGERAPDEETLETREREIQSILSKLSFVRTHLLKYKPVKKGFVDMFVGSRPEISRDRLREVLRTLSPDEWFEACRKAEEREKEILLNVAELKTRREILSPWVALDVPLESLASTKHCEVSLAVFPVAKWEAAYDAFKGRSGTLIEVSRDRQVVRAVALLYRDGAGTSLGEFLASLGGERVYLEGEGLVSGLIAEIDRNVAALEEERRSIERDCLARAERLVDVMALYDHYVDALNVLRHERKAARTRETVVIKGWVRQKDVSSLRQGFADMAGLEIVDVAPEPGDDVPVYLENPPLVRPFEVITNIFGYPSYDEVDPTPILAPFFWVYFGICLGDAVYGIVLSLVAWYFLKKYKLADGGQKLMRLLLYSGISTVIAGALMGSWLGDLPSVFFPGTAIERFVLSLKVLDPISDPLVLMVVSFLMGIFQIWVGIIVKMYSMIKSGDVFEGIMSQGSWVVFLPGLLVWAASRAGIVRGSWPAYWALAGALMVMVNSARGQRNWLLKPFSGLYGLYGVVGYFSDTMSYARLLALGLSSGVVAVVVNKLAQLVVDMIPVVGWGIVPIVLLVGHVFNLVINALGSFIHSGRLQFVEFFTKFFEGGGKPFKPLTRQSEFVSLS